MCVYIKYHCTGNSGLKVVQAERHRIAWLSIGDGYSLRGVQETSFYYDPFRLLFFTVSIWPGMFVCVCVWYPSLIRCISPNTGFTFLTSISHNRAITRFCVSVVCVCVCVCVCVAMYYNPLQVPLQPVTAKYLKYDLMGHGIVRVWTWPGLQKIGGTRERERERGGGEKEGKREEREREAWRHTLHIQYNIYTHDMYAQ